MAPTFCSRCGDVVAVEEPERCDPRDELAELDALLERLNLKRYNLKRKINRLQSSIVRQLPPDIMSTIFESCLPDFTDHQLTPAGDVDLSIPLSLGAICSYWRDIAWSTPTLWSSLAVRVTKKHDPHIVASIAHEWLFRSGQLPLSVRICSKLNDHKTVSALANIINRYSSRWSDLDLYIPESYYQHFRATHNHAPILRSIRFNCSAYASMKNFQLTCPRLERAVISYIYLDGINIQWDNLTHLTLHSMRIDDSFLILRNTPRLVFCKVSGYSPTFGKSIGIVALTSLKSLQLMTDDGDFFSNLITPHLEEFSLRDCNISSIVAITSYLRRSACSLRSFFTTLSTFQSFDDFMSLLNTMPSLNTLSITNTDLEDTHLTSPGDYDPRNILQLLSKVLSSQSTSLKQGFLPNLKIFEYTGKLNLRPEYFDDLHSLLPADNAVHGPLQLIKMDFTQHRIPRKMIPYFSSIVERGVRVDVKSYTEDIIQISESIDYFRRSRDWADNFDSSLFS